ncbi:MAG: PPC domain-containing protein [Gemmataceae bacterium]|nr:PPC domain-containing protein [Gemmataceae bacterium]
MRTASVFMGLTLAATVLTSASAQTSYPMITHVHPVAVQRGKTTEVAVDGQMNFLGVYKALFEGTGITAEIVPQVPPKVVPPQKPVLRSVKLKLTVAADAALGVRDFRVAAPMGVSSVGQLLIVDDPVVVEAGDNNTREKANPIALPCVVCGRIEAAEDVDFFKLRAEAGQTLTFEVLCARLQDRIHDLQKHADPMLTLYDADGRELAANDDYYFADPLLSYTIQKTGDYYIQVRDSKYDGDPRWVYALIATPRPCAAHVFPIAGNPGQALDVEPVGSAALLQAKVPFKVPDSLGIGQFQLDVKGMKTNPTTFIVSRLPQVLEVEPNDTPEQATRVTIPCGINGRIGTRRDLDHFVFTATKGKAIRFEVKARRFGTVLNSSLDSFIDVMTPKGDVLASNDDAFGKDSALVFTPPADGDYVLRIRDLNSKGGPTFVYYIEADWALPDYSLRVDCDKAMIGPGSSAAWYVQATRRNGFTGPIKVEVKGLPKGVTVNALTIPATMNEGLLVLTAAPDAPLDAVNVALEGSAAAMINGKEETLVRPVTPIQEIYLPGGGRGRFEVNLQTVSVTEPSDILKVEVKPQVIVLKPGQEARIDVTIQRRADFDKGVSLDILLRHLEQPFANPLPPGVTIEAGKSKTLLGGGTQGHIVIKAAPGAAPIENVPICVLAHVSVNFVVKVSYASPAILLTIEK